MTSAQSKEPPSKPSYEIKAFGGNGWVAVLAPGGDDIARALFANAVAKNIREKSALKPIITDAVAGMDSITLRFNPARTAAQNVCSAFAEIIDATPFDQEPDETKHIEIPVCYGGAYGPDFDALSNQTGLTAPQLIEAHAAQTYRVLTLGFAPGFAYLGPLDPQLRAPRLDTPRPQVEAGAVGVAGAFTGVYPLASPGGWRIIGRTPKRLFDPQAPSPFIFEAGAQVRFAPISADDFEGSGGSFA